MAIWVCSDLHLQHKNIIHLCRPQFKTIEEHDEYIIKQFNNTVGKDDLVYILGDVGFTPKDSLTQLVKRLHGRKILIVGNHDRLNPCQYQSMGFIEVIRHPVYYNNNIILSHLPIKEAFESDTVINIHGHIHQHKFTLPNYFNVNIELNDYKPINMEVFEQKAQQMCKQFRWEPFGTEWYAKYEIK